MSNPNMGWECPKCGRVFAPWCGQCQFCGPSKEYLPEPSSDTYTVKNDVPFTLTGIKR